MDKNIKVVLFKCDKCKKENTLVAYHNNFGWYCKECLTFIRDQLTDTIDKMDMYVTQINEQLEANLNNINK